MTAFNITRSARVANETGISGAEALEIETPASPDQQISAGTEELVTVPFAAVDLQAFSMVCDQTVEAAVLGVEFAIDSTAIGPPGVVVVIGNAEQELFIGDLIKLTGTVASDGFYLIETIIEAAGSTTITLKDGNTFPAVGGPVGSIHRVASKQELGWSYTITSTAVNGTIVLAGNLTDKFAEGEFLIIFGTAANDGFWEIRSVAFAAGETEVIVNITAGGAAGLPAAEGVIGTIHKCRATITLAANVPFLWSITSGVQNPFIGPSLEEGVPPDYDHANRGLISEIAVDNTDNAVAAQFRARIAWNSNIF